MKTLDDVMIRMEMMNALATSMEDAIDAAITASDMSQEALKVQHLFYILELGILLIIHHIQHFQVLLLLSVPQL